MSQIALLKKFKLKDFNLGYVKLSDGTAIILRAAIVDIKPHQTPSGVEFNVLTTGEISVYPSDSALNEVKDKPLIEPGKTPLDGWTLIDIVEKQSAYEEVEYPLNEKEKYIIKAEIDPLLVAKNIKYRTIQKEPIYAVKWITKTSWKRADDAKTFAQLSSLREIYNAVTAQDAMEILRKYMNDDAIGIIEDEVDIRKLSAFILWFEKLFGDIIHIVKMFPFPDVESEKLAFIEIDLDCDKEMGLKLSKAIKAYINSEGFNDISRKVALICQK